MMDKKEKTRLRLFDKKFREHKLSYIGQCLFATMFVYIVLTLINTAYDVVVAASIGASAFISFAIPHVKSSHPRYLIGGYVVGSICGTIMNYFGAYLLQANLQLSPIMLNAFVGAAAVGMTMFLMAVTNSEHPPAAALALGLTREENIWMAVLAALLSIILMSAFKKLFENKFIDLI